MFGHTFLVYAPDNRDLSFLNWTTVNFAADLRGVKWYEYVTKGVSGRFSAHYFILPLYEKINEYRGNETREIRFFPIKVTTKEFIRFKENITQNKEVSFPYKFFTNNCAHGTYRILYDSLEQLPYPKNGFMSPLDVVSLLDNEHRLAAPLVMPSLLERIQNTTDSEYAELEYMEWENKQKRIRNREDREQKMINLRYSITQREVKRPPLFVPDQKWRNPHGYSRLEIGGKLVNGQKFAHLAIRPLLHDKTDNQHFFSSTSSLEVLSTDFLFSPNNLILQSLDLVHIRSAVIYDRWFKSSVSDFYVGYQDGHSKFALGWGKSFYLASQKKVATEVLLISSHIAGKNYLGVEIQLFSHTTGRFRYGLQGKNLFHLMSFEKTMQFSNWCSFDLNQKHNLFLENTFDANKAGALKISLRSYF